MAGLVCWHCGESLRGVRRPIRRLSQCPRCKADLYTCRGCRHWAPKARGECTHERAERVADKASANFCTYFRPRPDAFAGGTDDRAADARAALDDLFGVDDEPAERPPLDPAARAREEQERSRRALDELFGLDEEGGEDGGGKSGDRDEPPA